MKRSITASQITANRNGCRCQPFRRDRRSYRTNPRELLASPEFVLVSQEVRRRFGIVLHDTTKCAECGDGPIVATCVGAAVLVARRQKTLATENTKLLGTLAANASSWSTRFTTADERVRRVFAILQRVGE